MARNKAATFFLSLLGLVGGSIAGFLLVISMMTSAARSGRPVGYEGFLFLILGPVVGGCAGVGICNSLGKNNDP